MTKKHSPTLNLLRFMHREHKAWLPWRCTRTRLVIQRPQGEQPWFLRFWCPKCNWDYFDQRNPLEVIEAT